ncbi:MAG: hypothetical protein SNJ49_10410 [Chloracidobacterium sp.]
MTRPTQLDPQYVNRCVSLPYGLQVTEVREAVKETYRLLNGLHDYLVGAGFPPLENLVLGNSLSGIISELLVKNIAKASTKLEANLQVGGHPDLLPTGSYPSNRVLKGEAGIEVKASVQAGGWQGHNPEACWLMVFRYTLGKHKAGTQLPVTFVEILCAKVEPSDWSTSGRNRESRRTPTASITASGAEKLVRTSFTGYLASGLGDIETFLLKLAPQSREKQKARGRQPNKLG